jgi:DNA-binding PadR family transcriptional regulator
VKKYEVTEEGLEWAQALLQEPVEAGKSYELDLSKQQETALVAAGWLKPKGGGS